MDGYCSTGRPDYPSAWEINRCPSPPIAYRYSPSGATEPVVGFTLPGLGTTSPVVNPRRAAMAIGAGLVVNHLMGNPLAGVGAGLLTWFLANKAGSR